MKARLALVGYGWIADLHCRAARAAGWEVVGVAGHDAQRARAFARAHDIADSTSDWQSLSAADGVDAVVVATPNFLHCEQTMHALGNGKHVLVEKPMAITVAEGEAMVEAATSAGRVLAVGHMWRYRDEVIALRGRIAIGEFGRVVRTHGYGIHAGWGPRGWFTDRALAGGGALIDMGIHAIDTARFLLGDPQPVRVVGSLGSAYGEYGVDDDGVVLIDWECGVRSVVECGWWQPRLGGVEADTEVLGTGGAARIWPDMPPVPADYEHCSVPMYARQLDDFRQACATGSVPIASAEVGLTALRIVEAAYASSEARFGSNVSSAGSMTEITR